MGTFGSGRHKGALVVGVITLASTALLVPTVFQAANAAVPVNFQANVTSGVQIYQCQAEGGTTKFVFKQPLAELEQGIHHDQGPVWQAPDGSAVRGAVTQTTPRPGTIPELTLSATSFGGPGLLSGVTEIRRINTNGGVAPEGTCQPDQTAEVPYTATYVFTGPGDDQPAGQPPAGQQQYGGPLPARLQPAGLQPTRPGLPPFFGR